MKKNLITGNLVEEYSLENTKIRIYDSAYAEASKEAINKILEQISGLAARNVSIDDRKNCDESC